MILWNDCESWVVQMPLLPPLLSLPACPARTCLILHSILNNLNAGKFTLSSNLHDSLTTDILLLPLSGHPHLFGSLFSSSSVPDQISRHHAYY